jgi:YD repeat-containing protein
MTDANGRTTTYAYDADGRLLNETPPLGHTTSYGYDAAGNLISKTDPNGTTIVYSYDALNRLIRTQYPDGTSIVYTYDANGNRVSKEETMLDDDEQETRITYYGYDYENRLTNLEYLGDSDDEDNILNALFEYDGNGIRS